MFLLSWNVLADSSYYSIQVISAQSPNLSDYNKLSEFGSIYTEHTRGSAVRVKVGSYFKRENAEIALRKIRERGFPDAFISAYSEKTRPLPKKLSRPLPILEEISDTEKLKTPKLEKKPSPLSPPMWSKLTPEQKRNVVYLDGILHLRVNDDFIPLSREY